MTNSNNQKPDNQEKDNTTQAVEPMPKALNANLEELIPKHIWAGYDLNKIEDIEKLTKILEEMHHFLKTASDEDIDKFLKQLNGGESDE